MSTGRRPPPLPPPLPPQPRRPRAGRLPGSAERSTGVTSGPGALSASPVRPLPSTWPAEQTGRPADRASDRPAAPTGRRHCMVMPRHGCGGCGGEVGGDGGVGTADRSGHRVAGDWAGSGLPTGRAESHCRRRRRPPPPSRRRLRCRGSLNALSGGVWLPGGGGGDGGVAGVGYSQGAAQNGTV